MPSNIIEQWEKIMEGTMTTIEKVVNIDNTNGHIDDSHAEIDQEHRENDEHLRNQKRKQKPRSQKPRSQTGKKTSRTYTPHSPLQKNFSCELIRSPIRQDSLLLN